MNPEGQNSMAVNKDKNWTVKLANRDNIVIVTYFVASSGAAGCNHQLKNVRNDKMCRAIEGTWGISGKPYLQRSLFPLLTNFYSVIKCWR
jgi:hypothetical protein